MPFVSCIFVITKLKPVPFFISSNLLPLNLLYFKSIAILIHDISNNTSPLRISNLFNYQHNIHSHNTRSSTRGNFFLEYSDWTSKTFIFQGMVLKFGITYLMKFVKYPKQNLNAKFTICFFRDSTRQTNTLICWI